MGWLLNVTEYPDGGTVPAFPGWPKENHENSVRIAGVPTETQTERPPNMRLERYT
jgi:hypothetical protein